MNFEIRTAVESDFEAIEILIAASIRKLGASDYSAEQIEAALKTAFGLDRQLVADRTYFIVETDQKAVACGGWSYRQTLFGNDLEQDRDATRIDPQSGAAKIRAFFVDAEFARMGIGSMILEKCEEEALKAGFTKFELMSTLPGLKLYDKHGFVAGTALQYPLGESLSIEFVPMLKQISKN